MSLPGKLCIGILEEDNPLKAYFRFKPLLVAEGGRYVPYAEPQSYPEDGCIRIVPDKNESFRFKARMRQMGLFCAVDLRAHPDDNDKIRPNKNYREGSQEQNAFILYSDVIHEPTPETIFEILPEAEPGVPRPRPRTAAVLLQGEALNPERFEWTADPETGERCTLHPTGKRVEPGAVQAFDLPGFGGETISFAIALPAEAPAGPAKKPAAPEASPRASVPAAPEPVPQAIEKPAEPRPRQAEVPDKPWIHRDHSMQPAPVDPRLSPTQRSLAAQSGMNPRRGRSLQELIDEKWQQSRLGQLGQPVAPIQTGAPVSSPVENAVEAVRDVWNQPQLRQDLLQSLGGIEEFGASLEECREAARKLDIERHLESLEARRLALLGELDHLTLQHAETREALMRQLSERATGELADALARTQSARAEQKKYEQLADEARAAARDARRAVDDLTNEELERRLSDFALNQRMVERLALLRGEAEPLPAAPEFESTDLNGLARRLEARFAAEGLPLGHEAALNLCACAAIGPALILSGPVGCGKTTAARLLADALGLAAVDRCAEFPSGKGSLEGDARLAALDALPDAPALLILDDANLSPAADPLRGLDALNRPQWRLCLTVQDDACPLRAHALDRGFTVRLSPDASAPWRPRRKAAAVPQPPVVLSLDIPESPLPTAAEDRVQALREALARANAAPSPRALDAAWRYCALMLSALPDADPLHIVDLAVAQRLLPPLLAGAPLDALRQLPALLDGLPLSRALLRAPLPIQL